MSNLFNNNNNNLKNNLFYYNPLSYTPSLFIQRLIEEKEKLVRSN